MAKLTGVHQALNECILERDALAESHTELMEALDLAQRGCGSSLHILINRHNTDHELWLETAIPAEEDARRGYDAAEAALDKARKL